MADAKPKDPGSHKIVPLTRVQWLTDALFALSMMIILTQVDYPDPRVVTSDEQIKAFLADQVPAIEVYTINGAYLTHFDEVAGSIEVGKQADFVVLSQNMFEVEPMKLYETKPLRTVFAGKVVYECQ